MRTLFTFALTIFMAVSLFGQAAAAVPHPKPAPSTPNSATPVEASTPVVAAGCSRIPGYVQSLNGDLSASGTFLKFLNDANFDYSTVTASQAKTLLKDADALLKKLGDLKVPGVYATGHKGVIGYLTFLRQEISFYTVDSSTVPDINAFDDSLQNIYDGEVAAAKGCPTQIKQVGGFIFINPDDLKDQVDTSK